MKKYKLKTTKVDKVIVEGWNAMCDGVVDGYKNIEDNVVKAYKKVENKFIDMFLEEVIEGTDTSNNDNR